MKKSVMKVMVAVALLMSGNVTANAQLSKILNGAGKVLGSVTGQQSDKTSTTTSSSDGSGLLSALTTIFDKNKTATADDLAGTWTYTEPAIVFSSDNALKNIGGKVASATIEKKLQKQFDKYGIKKGTMSMTFDKDGNFTQTVAKQTLKGTYTIDGKSVSLKYGGNVKQLLGTTQVDGNSLLIVMDVSKLLTYAKTIGSLTGNATLKTATSLLSGMDGMQCGFRLEK